ncbi:Ig domain-containing protein [Frondihabitans sp. 4ASC-45]|uniref:beta strand repeat-containing protein n=1 Tax=Frondihabitans sp. 4ASC-45 TaxID=3111636 RepID=UPI003C22C709
MSAVSPAHSSGTVDVVATTGGASYKPVSTTTAASFRYNANPAISTTSLPAPVVGQAYNGQVVGGTAAAGTLTYAVSSGSLPTGLSLDSTTGTISGTPTTANTATFTITATNASGSDSKTYTLAANAAPKIVTGNFLPAVVGNAYTDQISATGTGTITYSVSSGGLPAGLSLDSRTGKISGTPTTEGSSSFTIAALNDIGTDSKSFVLATTTAPSITTSKLIDPVVGKAYNDQISSSGTAAITYAVSAGSLPAGLSLSSSGALSGTPTTEGSSSFSITASSASGSNTKAFTLVTTAAPSITTTGLAAPLVGKAYSDQVMATGTGTITYTVSSGALPAGLSLDGRTGRISGTPTQESTTIFTIRALNATGSDSRSFTVTTSALPSIVTLALPLAVTGKDYSEKISTSGTSPLTFAISSGQLPAGLSLDSSTGKISGASASEGSSTFTVTATNAVGSDSRSYTVVTATAPTITTTALGDAGAFKTYNSTISVVGTGPFTYAVSAGTLPAGLTLDAASGVVSGQVTNAGSYTFGVSVSNVAGTQTKTYTIDVLDAPEISTTTLDDATIGSPYVQVIDTTGAGSISYAVSDGSLPEGLTLNARTGVITGTPTADASSIFTVTASNEQGSDSVQYTLVIRTKPILSTSGVNDGVIGSAYLQQLAATGSGTLNYKVVSGALPAGISLDASTGVISGIPTTFETALFAVQVSNQYGTDTKVFSTSVHTPPKVITASVNEGTVGKKYSQSIAATGEGTLSYTMSVGALPSGLTLDRATGAITGTPTQGGTSTFTVTVVNAFGSASKTYTTTVHTPPTISTGTLAAGTVRGAYTQTIVASGEGTLSYAVTKGALPKGLVLNKASGAITGTPTNSGKSTYTVTVTNKFGSIAKAFTVKVAAAKLTASVPAGKKKAGSKVVVTVAGLENGETATLKLGSTNYGTVKANTAGVAKKTVVLNAKLKAAKYSFVVTGSKHGKTAAKAAITVVKK